MAFGKRADIVAAELLSIKDKASLIDAISFTLAGDHIAGLAGAFVGASLIPSKLVYEYKVLRADGSYDRIKCNGDDPRNELLMNMPYIPDYLSWQESENQMADDSVNITSEFNDSFTQAPTQGHVNPMPTMQIPQSSNGDVVIGAGNYIFGQNFPTGIFDLQVLSGEGAFWIHSPNDDSSVNWMGGDHGAMSWNGLSSEGNKSFTLEGSLRVRVTRARMIQI